MRRIYLPVVLFLSFIAKSFASVDTINIYSASMFKNVKCVVITPSDYNKSNKNYPVVYLLHGYSGNYSDWVKKDADMQTLADENK